MTGALFQVTTPEALAALYGEVGHASRVKQTDRLTPSYRTVLEAAPLVMLATVGAAGLDCTPRGDRGHVVSVVDDRTLILPDRRGNNRIDSLRNIVEDPRVALLALVPGMNETLRIDGHAEISIDPALLAAHAVEGRAPVTVLVIRIASVFFQCGRALLRAGMWDPANWPTRAGLPSPGTMLAEVDAGFDHDGYDAALPARQATSLY